MDAANGAPLRVHFPPDALRGLRPGGRVTVALAIRKAIDSTSNEGAGTHVTDPETGSPGARPPAAR